jgi:hypothetical protein
MSTGLVNFPKANISQEDEDLQGIAQALSGHLDTIQGNITKVEGISQAMTKSRGALQATLFDHLESDEYEKIVLG